MASASSGPTPPTEEDKLKPCVVTFVMTGDRLNEPPPQPRVRKVTTVTNALAVVIRNSPTELGVWVLTACKEKAIPKTNPHLFADFHLGTWFVVGVYPDCTIASFSPWPFVLKAYETAIINSGVYMKRSSADFQYEKTVSFSDLVDKMGPYVPYNLFDRNDLNADFFMVPGFGLVLAHSSFKPWLKQRNETCSDEPVWIQWCGEVSPGCCWTVNSFIRNCGVEETFSELELKECAEYIRNREIHNDYPPATSRVVARHFGLITDVNEQKKTCNIWSPKVSLESDHVGKIPQPPKHREIDSPMLAPLIGQWVQFDIQAKDMDKYMNSKTGTRLSMPEYLPITSPPGVGVAHANRVVRIMLSCVLVKGTDHPLLFELPHYGFVIDRRAGLVSGAFMQLVLEKTPARIRRSSGVGWKVIESMLVRREDVAVEKMHELLIHYIPNRDSMEVSTFAPQEKATPTPAPPTQSKTTNTSPPTTTSSAQGGVTTLKYQQPPPQQVPPHYTDARRDFFSGVNVQMNGQSNERGNYSSKRKPTNYTGATMEGHAIVEKLNNLSKSGILWILETSSSAHINFSDDFNLAVGDYAYVKLVQKPDSVAKSGFRWACLSHAKKQAPYSCNIKNNSLLIQDHLTYSGVDRFNRHTFSSPLFATVLDPMNVLQNTASLHSVPATVSRRKVQHPMHSEYMSFQWVIMPPNNMPFYQPMYQQPSYAARNHRHFSMQQSHAEMRQSPTEHISPSPPPPPPQLKSIAVSVEE